MILWQHLKISWLLTLVYTLISVKNLDLGSRSYHIWSIKPLALGIEVHDQFVISSDYSIIMSGIVTFFRNNHLLFAWTLKIVYFTPTKLKHMAVVMKITQINLYFRPATHPDLIGISRFFNSNLGVSWFPDSTSENPEFLFRFEIGKTKALLTLHGPCLQTHKVKK